MKITGPVRPSDRGFAMIAVVVIMVLVVLLGVALLSLSTITTRTSDANVAMAEARANARLGLMVAIGRLQEEMGPDMRVSYLSSILDDNEDTEEIDGVNHARWMGVHDSWGNWLNDTYTRPGETNALNIQSTYSKGREEMFRRWLVSLPDDLEADFDAPLDWDGGNDENSVYLVHSGSLGDSVNANEYVRAGIINVNDDGGYAWWISPENQKARIDMTKDQRELEADGWEIAHGGTNEVGVGAINGFGAIDDSEETSDKLVSLQTLVLGLGGSNNDIETVQTNYYDLTPFSRGLQSSVRTGALKKDISLLFEKNNSQLPDPYRFRNGDIQEPSIRPMSPDLADKPVLENRHFASWTNMRHFYRMYRDTTDATPAETDGSGALDWSGRLPYTDFVSTSGLRRNTNSAAWDGSNNYWRVPILAKITFIYSLLAEPVPNDPQGRYDCYQIYTPVFTYWNPYNTQLRIPNDTLFHLLSPYKTLPNGGELWLGNNIQKQMDALGLSINARAKMRSDNGNDIIFEPGEFKIFSHRDFVFSDNTTEQSPMYPGFNPQGYAGEKWRHGRYRPDQNPGLAVRFSHSVWGGNINLGNTGGSLVMVGRWDPGSTPGDLPMTYANDWFDKSQQDTPITPPGAVNVARWVFDGQPMPVAYAQLVIKGLSEYEYESIPSWAEDWRSRNWIQAPPFYFGSGMYCSEIDSIADTQRMDNPYVMNFGPMTESEMPKVVFQIGDKSFLGSGTNPFERVAAVPALELPTAPIGSLAGFSGMRINPGWVKADQLNPGVLFERTFSGNGVSAGEMSRYASETKVVAYQSGVTGPGIGNSFLHPMIERSRIYRYLDNSKSQDVIHRNQPDITSEVDTQAYCDYWDHVFLLNDALWDDYFVSSLADQSRPTSRASLSLSGNIDALIDGAVLANGRMKYYSGGKDDAEVKSLLEAQEGYLKVAGHLMIEGMFNVNSTSVDAWYALFAGIRERKIVYRSRRGGLLEVEVPSDKRIAVSRFNTEVTNQEMDDAGDGVTMNDGTPGWSSLRFLDDDQLRDLAEQCVKQVKLRGPFLNFSEFINRRLSNDELGLKGALQSAIDYDDASPDPASINYRYKSDPEYMIEVDDIVDGTLFGTPEAMVGSRFAGIPGYVIQSDLLKPIANHLSVRDDTFKIRSYGESRDKNNNVIARVWCEAVVQRVPEYVEEADSPDTPTRELNANGQFVDSNELSEMNQKYGRQFKLVSFRWLSPDEV